MLKSILICLSFATALSACSLTPVLSDQGRDMLIPTPRQAGIEQQAAIARLTEVISLSETQGEQLAHLYYDRGVRYDTLGLKALAHLDFNRALRMKPDFADAYNFIGIHFTQGEQFVDAFEAFGSALELQPDHNYALLNRGIARYYAGRKQLAVADLSDFYQLSPQDPYRALWLYLAELEADPAEASSHLALNRKRLSLQDWGTYIVDLYLERLTLNEFLRTVPQGLTSSDGYSERLCEAYFYLGKMAAHSGQPQNARNYFRLALATNVHDFVEHRYALLELSRLANY